MSPGLHLRMPCSPFCCFILRPFLQKSTVRMYSTRPFVGLLESKGLLRKRNDPIRINTYGECLPAASKGGAKGFNRTSGI